MWGLSRSSSFLVRTSILSSPPPLLFHRQSRPIRLSNIPPAAFQRIAAFDGNLPSDKDQGGGQPGRKRKLHDASSIVLDILKNDAQFTEMSQPVSSELSISEISGTFVGRLEMASRVQIDQVLESSLLAAQRFLVRWPELDDFLRSMHGIDSEKAVAVVEIAQLNVPTATWMLCETEVRFPKSKRVMDKLGITLSGSVDYSFDVVSAALFAQAKARVGPWELVRSQDLHRSGSYPGKRSTCQAEGKTPDKFKRPVSMRQAVAQAILVSRRHTAVNILTCGSLWTFIVVTRAIGSQVPFKYRTTKAIHISRLDILRKLVFAAILAHPDDFEYILGRILAPAPAPSPATPRTPARASSKQSSVVPSLPDKFTSAAKPKKSAAARAKGGKGPGKK
ncbi:hypothetical protein HMN09_01072100 [Mycena chlorophos]|uniref:Uncharacterized protein n=1 Tax=Mycena chlorophos TaxID=658473 RepID=A0A8H6SC02_MYCCL|nr:hypothetical protein HMN09_01072100 [Mycena chlorophos]